MIDLLFVQVVQCQSVANGFFISFVAVLIHFALVLGAVGQTAGAADAAAGTGHAFDEVILKQVLLLLKKTSCLAWLYSTFKMFIPLLRKFLFKTNYS